jgi:hypothetical protein
VLKVVEDQQQALFGEMPCEPRDQGLPCCVGHTQPLSNCGGDEGGVAERAERDEDDPIREVGHCPLGDSKGEAGFARATGASQGDEPSTGVPHERRQVSQLPLAPEEGGEGHGERGRPSEDPSVRLR